jgi:hypothetical protein
MAQTLLNLREVLQLFPAAIRSPLHRVVVRVTLAPINTRDPEKPAQLVSSRRPKKAVKVLTDLR